MSIVVLAEKPSVARDLAAVLGATSRRDGYLEGAGYRVTWAIGHLVELAQPHEIRPEWKSWRPEHLPILPERFPLVVRDSAAAQLRVVSSLLCDPQTERVVVATDAGREGELIFRYIYEHSGCDKPFERLWISSLTEAAIHKGMSRLRPGQDFDGLAAAARARSRADWLVGMNLSRVYSVISGETLSVGRVQTPTLAMLVERERAIRDFVREPYHEVEARFSAATGEYVGIYHRIDADDLARERRGKIRRLERDKARLPADGVEAAAIVARARAGEATVHRVERTTRATPPPLLFDLTELQREANRLYGFTAKRTLELAQELYEKHKVLSYPRTDSRHLSTEVAETLPSVLEVVAPRYEGLVAPPRVLGPRFVDDAKVTDHHAIIPTPTRPRLPEGSELARLYDLVCRRLLSAYHEDCLEAVVTVDSRVSTATESDEPLVDSFLTRGVSVERLAWRVLDLRTSRPTEGKASGRAKAEPDVPPGLSAEDALTVLDARALDKLTRPPSPHTEATILSAMETCGRSVDERELSAAMRDSGIGTPATRAAILENLIARGYVERQKKNLRATPKGEALIDRVHPDVKSPSMTGAWELRLRQMERNAEGFEAFMEGIEGYVRDVVGATMASAPPRPAGIPSQATGSYAPPTEPRSDVSAEELRDLLRTRFGHDDFRPHQEEICRAFASGQSGLVVMPTGAGKSLCFQLPGLARGATTLVISPLIALIVDQVDKLCANGMRARGIHSGQTRAESRQICVDYLRGELDFLFIAPERLSVPGFPEMLAKRPPGLIAVDEAHCISHWGHDFRPDYRMLAERLEPLSSVPIAALTATATPLVQQDIVSQLGLERGRTFIHGFRRSNIAVEVVETPAADRADWCETILLGEGRLPAIVYAPTRKEAESIAGELKGRMRVAAYHAGLPADARARVQEAFLGSQLDVIVATIAFGMGIDKRDVRTVVHAGLPGSVEGYYQEIGRAGRDGLPSRAVLLYAYADVHTHRFFFERDYPELERVEKLYALLSAKPTARASLERALRTDSDEIERILDKLWVHGGALIDADDEVRRGAPAWKKSYGEQRAHRKAQLDNVLAFVGSARCRMLSLVEHFGDGEDDGSSCGLCDVCTPDDAVAARTRPPTPVERRALEAIVELLSQDDGLAVGTLFKRVAEGTLERAGFQRVLQGLGRAGIVQSRDDSFDKGGRTVRYQRVFLADDSTEAARARLDEVRLPMGPSPAGGAKAKKSRAKAAPRARAAGKTQPRRSSSLETTEAPVALVQGLREWRRETARVEGVPAFRVLTDRQLVALAESAPRDRDGLRAEGGLSVRTVARYGEAILRVMEGA